MKPERFLVGDVIGAAYSGTRSAQCAVVIASLEVDGVWVIQARYLFVGGEYDPSGVVFAFYQRDLMWRKVGHCRFRRTDFSDAVFDPTPNPQPPTRSRFTSCPITRYSLPMRVPGGS